ncbi:MAG: DEAD/DEAH box helicase family protein [Proteobacteria bacterium]|nr:DEAD/DEAH box helicase family protein [Pseudomonadota bacterium]
MLEDQEVIHSAIKKLESRLEEINKERECLLQDLKNLHHKVSSINTLPNTSAVTINAPLTLQEKTSLFRTLFKGREDVYPRLWMSKKSGAKGYSPVCENEWIPGICKKPTVKCGDCSNRRLSPLTDDVIRKHLGGEITIGIYPLLQDETCYFLAIDFDRETWQDDVKAFFATCKLKNIPSYLERSRSGSGGHVWIFFSGPVPAVLARQLGTFLITETMSQRHQLDMRSYDRLFPNQDTMPKGGFGNLIALPLQKIPSKTENSVFLGEDFNPHPDQWAYLANVKRMSCGDVQEFINEALRTSDILGIRIGQTEEHEKPWEKACLFNNVLTKLSCKLPERINGVLADRLYIKKEGLPSQLLTQIKRLASFQNPEFYKKQSLRLSTALTPRIICCAEDMGEYLAIPRGCLEDLKSVLSENNITFELSDKRFEGKKCEFKFNGQLTDDQRKACNALFPHETGVCVAPPGIGKTIIGIHLISSRKTNTLVLVHRKPLLEQWRTQIASFLGIPIQEIGQIGGGKNKATNFLDVAMLQSLDKKNTLDLRIKNYGHIIVDECHHIAAVSFERVMMGAHAKYITGLTATPYRRDGHQPIIIMQCGPVRYKATSQMIREFPLSKKLITKVTNFSCQWSEENPIHSIWPLLIKDGDRNGMICDDVLNNLKEKRSPIILTERKEHLEILKEKLQPIVKHLVILHGGMKGSIRKEMIAKLAGIPDNEEHLILATGPYIGEGFDDPRLDTLFLVMPFSFKGKMVQYAGRLHRQYKGKTEIRIYDYVDSNVSVLQRMYQRRFRTYKAMGYVETSL